MFQKILLATDLTPISDRATAYAKELARRFDAELLVVHAIEAVRTVVPEVSVEIEQLHRKLQEGARDKAAAILRELEGAGVRATLVTPVGRRWEVITRAAAESGADLVVLGTQTVREGEKVYLGSTSHKVFLMADRPVLVIKD